MNNEILLYALQRDFDISADASGRNDLVVEDKGEIKKISGSAYKLRLGNPDISGLQHSVCLHHGTMMLDVELDALKKYLNPSKAKLESKGVDSVISRVINLKQINNSIDHESFCHAVQESFIKKWNKNKDKENINFKSLPVKQLSEIPKLMKIY